MEFRFMACSFTQSILAAAVAIVVGGSALAQESSLKAAVNQLRLGHPDEAKATLRTILQQNPSNEEALKLYQSVSQDEWMLLLTGTDEEMRKVAQSLLERAKVERQARSRDAAAIGALVDQATAKDSDYGTRQAAINKLIAQHGEFAVPALVEKLGNADDAEGQIQAVYTLSQLNTAAVLPLIEALKSSKELTVQNAAAALHHIGDLRAAAAMAQLANDSRAGVAMIAKSFVQKKGVKGAPVELLLEQARNYLKGEIPAGGFSEVVWRLADDKLVATDVPALLYGAELAKSCAADAVAIAPQDANTVSTLAECNLAQSNLITTGIAGGDESLRALEPVAGELKIAALASGVAALRKALDDGVKEGLAPVALGAIDALATAESADTIGQSNSLVAALGSTDKRVQYAAAAALVRASGGVNIPQADKVVAVLGEAVAEEAVRNIQVIDPTKETGAAVTAANGTRGSNVAVEATAINGMRKTLIAPPDVLVINEIIPDGLPEDVIGNVKKDPRAANTKIVIIAKDVEAAKTRFGDTVQGVVAAPLTGEALITEVNRVLEGASNPIGARAEGFATHASESLLAIAAKKGAITGALENLGRQLNRGDAVAVPAAKALGFGGAEPQLDALVKAMEGGSAEVKKASAEAIGNILSRSAKCPEPVSKALIDVLAKADADVALRTAAAGALGKAKLDPKAAGEVQQKLRKVAGSAKTDG
jgi:hypothetical protein